MMAEQTNISNWNEESEKEGFFNALRAMMCTFGDVREPLQESVETVYKLLRADMNSLLMEAKRFYELRNGKKISHKELLFRMRKNKGQIKRLIQYLGAMDKKFEASSSDFAMEQDVPNKNRVEKCKAFLAYIGDLGEYTSILEKDELVDTVYQQMLERRNSGTKWMDLNEYLEFNEKILQASFCAKEKLCNFEKWLLNDNVIPADLPISQLAFDIMQFLARETVSKIVDLALLSKSNKNRKQEEESIDNSLSLLHFSNLSRECNISELFSSSSSTDKSFDHLYHASDDVKESVEHTTKSSPNNPESVTTDSHVSAPNVKWADEDSLHPLSSFPGTSMDFVNENKPEGSEFFRNAKDAISSKSYFQGYVAESDEIPNQTLQEDVPNQSAEILIENISNDDDETPCETDANIEQSNTRHSSNDMPYKNLTQDAKQSDTRHSSNEINENIMRKYGQESFETELQNQVPITPEEIIQGVGFYIQPNFCSREKMVKIKLLCIE